MDMIITVDCPECSGEGSVPFFEDQPHRIERRPCGMCLKRWNDANPLPKRPTVEDLQAQNARLLAVVDSLPICAYGSCLKKGIWDFSDTEHGLRVYCQQHAEDRARDAGDFVEHCAELVSYAGAIGALDKDGE